ncbi:MAG TPA: alkaline phosphatase [Rectinemataceae bacterium]|nr:alkaline phosphatase [Rectinemataceae bacterium]
MKRNWKNGIFLAMLIVGAQARVFAQNVIMLIPDGMSVAGTTLARFFKGESLALDEMACGLVSTWSSDGTIADSAPAGSAFATGWASQSGNIASIGKAYLLPGVSIPEGDALRPVATILEAARLSGRSTGIISTSEFMHATPADFSAHDPSRSNYDNLTEQIIYNGLTVILGGGTPYLQASARKDHEDMRAVLAERGYGYADTTAALRSFEGDRLVGVFGKNKTATAMSYDIDRDPEAEPSLSEMTTKAIEILSANKKGFFLMVEGSKVDWAAHANDPVALVTDIIAFDDAVSVALDFAKKDGNTVVVAATDHGNSGISIGDRSISSGYDKTPWTTFIAPLKKARLTGEGLEAKLPAGTMIDKKDASGAIVRNDKGEAVKIFDGAKAQAIRDVVANYIGISDLTGAEVESIGSARAGSVNYAVGPIIAARAKIGFTTNGHTGEDVVLYGYDPFGKRLSGLVKNTDIAAYMASVLKVDLAAATSRLFLDANAMFAKKGASVSVDASDKENPVLVVAKGGQTLRIPRNKSVAYLDGATVNSEGVAIFNGSTWFVSRSLIDLIE